MNTEKTNVLKVTFPALIKLLIGLVIMVCCLMFGLAGCALRTYKIDSMEDWEKLANEDDPLYGSVELLTDLDFSGREYLPIEIDYCNFYGNGHSLKNITFNDTLEPSKLFKGRSLDEINDLKIENITINSSIKDADVSILGPEVSDATFRNVEVSGTINAPFAYSIGGFYSSSKGGSSKFYDCTSNLTINGGKVVGGFVGTAQYVVFEGCENKTEINATEAAGGLVGKMIISQWFGATFNNCKNSATIKSQNMAGGLLGLVYRSTVTNCENNGAVSGAQYVGGIAGTQVDGSIKNCTNNGTVTSALSSENKFACIGGICGIQKSGEIMTCVNNGEIKNENYISGGIIGYCLSVVAGCENKGRVVADIGAGGIIGFAGDNGKTIRVSHCINNAEVEAKNYAGGIIGIADLNASDSEAYEKAKGAESLAGAALNGFYGIFGIEVDSSKFEEYVFNSSNDILKQLTKAAKLEIAYCESNNRVIADNYAGGFIGIMLSCSVEQDELYTNTYNGQIDCSGVRSEGFTYVNAEDIYKVN